MTLKFSLYDRTQIFTFFFLRYTCYSMFFLFYFCYCSKVLKLMNERDILKHKLFFDKSFKEVERKELENQLFIAREELAKEQKFAKDKMARLEEVSSDFIRFSIFFFCFSFLLSCVFFFSSLLE